jgi:hypothetical protein
MELIRNDPDPHDCREEVSVIAADIQDDGVHVLPGAEIRCQCSIVWRLADERCQGHVWRRLSPSGELL